MKLLLAFIAAIGLLTFLPGTAAVQAQDAPAAVDVPLTVSGVVVWDTLPRRTPANRIVPVSGAGSATVAEDALTLTFDTLTSDGGKATVAITVNKPAELRKKGAFVVFGKATVTTPKHQATVPVVLHGATTESNTGVLTVRGRFERVTPLGDTLRVRGRFFGSTGDATTPPSQG